MQQSTTTTETTDYTTRLCTPELPCTLDLPYTARAYVTGPDGFSHTACLSFMHRDDGIELLVWGDARSCYEQPDGAETAIRQAEQQLAEAVGQLLSAHGYAPRRVRQTGWRDLELWYKNRRMTWTN